MRIETKNATVAVGKKTIVTDASVTVDNKQFVGIIGANGSGKSTLLKAIYRVLDVKEGEVLLGNRALSTLSLKDSAKDLGVMTQMSSFNFDFSVIEVVMMGRTPHKRLMENDNEKDYKIAYDSLSKVDMLDFAERKYNTLSGGEKQRVLIARALTGQPKALVLDEPTNHLDIKYQINLMDLVKKLDIEVFAAIHDLNLAAHYCDYLYVMHQGHLVLEGAPRHVLTADNIERYFGIRPKIIKDGEDVHISFT